MVNNTSKLTKKRHIEKNPKFKNHCFINDFYYVSVINKFIGILMLDGKKMKSEKILNEILREIKKKHLKETKKRVIPINFVIKGIDNIVIYIDEKKLNLFKETYQIPVIQKKRKVKQAISDIIEYSRNNSKQKESIAKPLTIEILKLNKKKGHLIEKKKMLSHLAKTKKKSYYMFWNRIRKDTRNFKV